MRIDGEHAFVDIGIGFDPDKIIVACGHNCIFPDMQYCQIKISKADARRLADELYRLSREQVSA